MYREIVCYTPSFKLVLFGVNQITHGYVVLKIGRGARDAQPAGLSVDVEVPGSEDGEGLVRVGDVGCTVDLHKPWVWTRVVGWQHDWEEGDDRSNSWEGASEGDIGPVAYVAEVDLLETHAEAAAAQNVGRWNGVKDIDSWVDEQHAE